MSNHFINHSVYSSRPTLVESPQKSYSEHLTSAPFLLETKKALHTLEKQHLKSEMGDPRAGTSEAGDGEDEAIGYGFLVEAKLALYKLENEYSKLQELESEITQQMYKLTNHLAKGLSDQTYSAMHLEAEQLKTDAYSSFISGAGQIGVAAFYQGLSTRKIDQREKIAAADDESLDKIDHLYEHTPRTGSASNLPDGERSASPEQEQINKRIEDRQKGTFERDKEGKILFDKDAEKEAAQMATDEQRTAIRKKIKELKEETERTLKNASNDRLYVSNNTQIAQQVIGSVSQGTASMVKASQKNEQAVSEANKAATNAAQSMVNPSDAYKAMDGYQQDALNVLKVIEAIEQANKYQPAH